MKAERACLTFDSEAYAALVTLVIKLERISSKRGTVIGWGSPIPSFGNLSGSTIATVGINPSNREFVSDDGKELTGNLRRFHTLDSLGIHSWLDADARHLEAILQSCDQYFCRNPYDAWFRRLNSAIGGLGGSYYGLQANACHIDLIPFATREKWSNLKSRQRTTLIETAADTLGLLLQNSTVKVLVLNGQSVVNHFQDVADVVLERQRIEGATLPRVSGTDVAGYGYRGRISNVCGIPLWHPVAVLGYNHNLQSSFGVTKDALKTIREWLCSAFRECAV